MSIHVLSCLFMPPSGCGNPASGLDIYRVRVLSYAQYILHWEQGAGSGEAALFIQSPRHIHGEKYLRGTHDGYGYCAMLHGSELIVGPGLSAPDDLCIYLARGARE